MHDVTMRVNYRILSDQLDEKSVPSSLPDITGTRGRLKLLLHKPDELLAESRQRAIGHRQ